MGNQDSKGLFLGDRGQSPGLPATGLCEDMPSQHWGWSTGPETRSYIPTLCFMLYFETGSGSVTKLLRLGSHLHFSCLSFPGGWNCRRARFMGPSLQSRWDEKCDLVASSRTSNPGPMARASSLLGTIHKNCKQ